MTTTQSIRLCTYTSSAWWRGRQPISTPLPGSEALAEALKEAGHSLFLTSRQASIVGAISGGDSVCELTAFSADSPMGMDIDGSSLAIGTLDSIDVYQALPGSEAGRTSLLKVATHRTGPVSVHEVAWMDRGIAFVNTAFSAVCVTRDDCNFEVVWKPSFIHELAPVDACHLNGMAMEGGSPKFVTALAESSEPGGWRLSVPDNGVLIDIETGSTLRGLSLPHSPHLIGNNVWLVEAGKGLLVCVDEHGCKEVVASLDGVARGLALLGNAAIVGISGVRKSSSSSHLVERFGESADARISLVDMQRGNVVEQIRVPGLQEISSLTLVPYGSLQLLAPGDGAPATFICREKC